MREIVYLWAERGDFWLIALIRLVKGMGVHGGVFGVGLAPADAVCHQLFNIHLLLTVKSYAIVTLYQGHL